MNMIKYIYLNPITLYNCRIVKKLILKNYGE